MSVDEKSAAGSAVFTSLDPPVATLQASPWVARWIGRPAGNRRLLDFASGNGRHCRLALASGFRVLAVDRDEAVRNVTANEGIDKGFDKDFDKGIEIRVEDLETGRWSFSAERFEAVVVTNFLHRPRLDLLAGLLEPGGRLIYETFARGNERFGKPSNPAFLLADGELFAWARRCGLLVVAFEQGFVASPKSAALERLVAVKPPYRPESLPLDSVTPVLS